MSVRYDLSLSELAQILAKHYNIKSGFWELGFNWDISPIKGTKKDTGETAPGLALVINRLNFVEHSAETPGAFNISKLLRSKTEQTG